MKLQLLLNSLGDSAIHFPNNVAIVTDTTSWDYQQLWSRIAQFESALAEIALPARVAVAVTGLKTVDTLALMLALGKQGHTPLAVSSSLRSTVKPMMYDTAGVYCELAAESDSGRPVINLAVHGYTDPKLTAKVFYTESGGYRTYYRTGDRVARDEHGQLTLVGRTDFIVKVRGVRTNPLDIEQVLVKMPTVKNAVVIPVNDETAGVVLHVVVEPTQGQTLDGLTMRMFCALHLPQTSIPRCFHLHESPLPTTSTGKPDRTTIALSIHRE